MPETNVTVLWYAVVATCSAVAAIGMLVIQRRNLFASVRPELVLLGWGRDSAKGDLTRESKFESKEQAADKHDLVTIDAIKNVGCGPALHVVCLYRVTDPHLSKTGSFVSEKQLSILAPDETVNLGGKISLEWLGSLSGLGNRPRRLIDIHLLAWDSHGRKYRTRYALVAYIPRLNNEVANAIAPDLVLQSRVTTPEADWVIRLRDRLSRVPILRRVAKRNKA